jgi:hypothetical protein
MSKKPRGMHKEGVMLDEHANFPNELHHRQPKMDPEMEAMAESLGEKIVKPCVDCGKDMVNPSTNKPVCMECQRERDEHPRHIKKLEDAGHRVCENYRESPESGRHGCVGLLTATQEKLCKPCNQRAKREAKKQNRGRLPSQREAKRARRSRRTT